MVYRAKLLSTSHSFATNHVGFVAALNLTWFRAPVDNEPRRVHGSPGPYMVLGVMVAHCLVEDANGLAYAVNCGGMAEWLKAAVLKTASRKWDVGSNPTPSATNHVGFVACPKPHMV